MSQDKSYLKWLKNRIDDDTLSLKYIKDTDKADEVFMESSHLKQIQSKILDEDKRKDGLSELKAFLETEIKKLIASDEQTGEATYDGKVVGRFTRNEGKIHELKTFLKDIDKDLEVSKTWRDRFSTFEHGNAERERVTQTRQLVENVLSKDSFLILAGETGHGKTTYSMLLGICLASGKDFLGNKVLEKCNVLYIDEENKTSILKEKQELIENGLGLEKVSNFFPMSNQGFNFSNEEDMEYLEDMIKELKIGLVIVDSLAVTIEYNENASSGFSNLYAKNLKVLTNRYGVSWVLIQHLSKGAIKSMKPENLLKLVRGSSALFYLADDCLFLRKEKDKLTIIPCKTRTNELGRPKDLRMKWSASKIELLSLGESTIGMNAYERCADALLKYCRGKSITEISTKKSDKDQSIATVREEHRFSSDTVNRAIRLLKQDGKIVPKEEGIYTLV